MENNIPIRTMSYYARINLFNQLIVTFGLGFIPALVGITLFTITLCFQKSVPPYLYEPLGILLIILIGIIIYKVVNKINKSLFSQLYLINESKSYIQYYNLVGLCDTNGYNDEDGVRVRVRVSDIDRKINDDVNVEQELLGMLGCLILTAGVLMYSSIIGMVLILGGVALMIMTIIETKKTTDEKFGLNQTNINWYQEGEEGRQYHVSSKKIQQCKGNKKPRE